MKKVTKLTMVATTLANLILHDKSYSRPHNVNRLYLQFIDCQNDGRPSRYPTPLWPNIALFQAYYSVFPVLSCLLPRLCTQSQMTPLLWIPLCSKVWHCPTLLSPFYNSWKTIFRLTHLCSHKCPTYSPGPKTWATKLTRSPTLFMTWVRLI